MCAEKYVLASSKPWHKELSGGVSESTESHICWVRNKEELEKVVNISSDIRYIFFLHWNWLVPEDIWQNYECVCFHMTDVPYGRGGSPLQNLIVRGHKNTMLTALRMVNEMDAGPIYTKRTLSLEGTAHDIYLRAGEISFDIINWMIQHEPTPAPQQGEPVVFKRRKPEQSRLPESTTIEALYDHIRMLDAPTYPHAFIDHGSFYIEFYNADMDGEELTATVKIRKKSDQEKS